MAQGEQAFGKEGESLPESRVITMILLWTPSFFFFFSPLLSFKL